MPEENTTRANASYLSGVIIDVDTGDPELIVELIDFLEKECIDDRNRTPLKSPSNYVGCFSEKDGQKVGEWLRDRGVNQFWAADFKRYHIDDPSE